MPVLLSTVGCTARSTRPGGCARSPSIYAMTVNGGGRGGGGVAGRLWVKMKVFHVALFAACSLLSVIIRCGVNSGCEICFLTRRSSHPPCSCKSTDLNELIYVSHENYAEPASLARWLCPLVKPSTVCMAARSSRSCPLVVPDGCRPHVLPFGPSHSFRRNPAFHISPCVCADSLHKQGKMLPWSSTGTGGFYS